MNRTTVITLLSPVAMYVAYSFGYWTMTDSSSQKHVPVSTFTIMGQHDDGQFLMVQDQNDHKGILKCDSYSRHWLSGSRESTDPYNRDCPLFLEGQSVDMERWAAGKSDSPTFVYRHAKNSGESHYEVESFYSEESKL